MFDEPELVTLQWGETNHTLMLEQRSIGIVLTMYVVKKKSTQPISIKAPIGVTIKIIEEAWNKQGQKWIDLCVKDGVIFMAARAIWLPNWCLLWSVLHVDGYPSDTLGFTGLTEEAWRLASDCEGAG